MIELLTSPGALSELSPVAPPKLLSQARDTSRNNPVTYVVDDGYMGTRTSDPCFRKMRRETTEYKALNEFLYFMKMVEPYVPDHIKDDARELRNELVFLGMSELHFAATALAKRLRHLLKVDNNPVYVDVGNSLSQCRVKNEMKSSQYILSLVLSKFLDDEFEEYEGRLKVYGGRGEIDKSSKILFLDDWIIGGDQMRERISVFGAYNNPGAHKVSVLVMAASSNCIDNGIGADSLWGEATYPVEAYYRLKNDHNDWGVSRVTGIHSSTDSTFGCEVDDIAYRAIEGGVLKGERIDRLTLPALVNIVRPYRNGEDFDGLSRFRQLLEKG
jgi:hypothetical protein